jgi:hypothetical protein
MGAFSNSEILSAVIVKWGQPAIESIAGSKLMQLLFLANLEAKIKSTGWVSPMWSLSKELSPVMSGLSAEIITPFLSNYLQGVPDKAIPQMAHTIVNNAIESGGLSLMEGNIIFEKEDMEELAKLLRYNLPIEEKTNYEVITNKTE